MSAAIKSTVQHKTHVSMAVSVIARGVLVAVMKVRTVAGVWVIVTLLVNVGGVKVAHLGGREEIAVTVIPGNVVLIVTLRGWTRRAQACVMTSQPNKLSSRGTPFRVQRGGSCRLLKGMTVEVVIVRVAVAVAATTYRVSSMYGITNHAWDACH